MSSAGAARVNFALLGAAGFVAPRHLTAIAQTGQRLVAAVDPHTSVGVLDQHFPDAQFFTSAEAFAAWAARRGGSDSAARVNYVSVCSPNHLHASHVRAALELGAHAICEKPLVIDPADLSELARLQAETGKRVFPISQLRLLPELQTLQRELRANPRPARKARVHLDYVTRRGPWYHASWKGSPEQSGGLMMNIGVHFFDLLLWLFGACERAELHSSRQDQVSGSLELAGALVQWRLSIRQADLPAAVRASGGAAHRALTIDGRELEFSPGGRDLHTRAYEEVLAGRGLGIEDARPAIELIWSLQGTGVRQVADERRALGGEV